MPYSVAKSGTSDVGSIRVPINIDIVDDTSDKVCGWALKKYYYKKLKGRDVIMNYSVLIAGEIMAPKILILWINLVRLIFPVEKRSCCLRGWKIYC